MRMPTEEGDQLVRKMTDQQNWRLIILIPFFIVVIDLHNWWSTLDDELY